MDRDTGRQATVPTGMMRGPTLEISDFCNIYLFLSPSLDLLNGLLIYVIAYFILHLL